MHNKPHTLESIQKMKDAKTRHGMTSTRFYKIWSQINGRCNNPNDKHYSSYGGRGIKNLWINFEDFKNDMYESYLEHFVKFAKNRDTSLDRINNNGNYYKENCRWATQREQCNNKRNNYYITFRNETKTMSEWASVIGINKSTLRRRLVKLSWSIEEALTTPILSKYVSFKFR